MKIRFHAGERQLFGSRRRSSFTTLMLLYATMHVFLGSVLTLSDALSPKHILYGELTLSRRPYLEVFYILDYLVSIFGLLVLSILSCEGERRDQLWEDMRADKLEVISTMEKDTVNHKRRGKNLLFKKPFHGRRKHKRESQWLVYRRASSLMVDSGTRHHIVTMAEHNPEEESSTVHATHQEDEADMDDKSYLPEHQPNIPEGEEEVEHNLENIDNDNIVLDRKDNLDKESHLKRSNSFNNNRSYSPNLSASIASSIDRSKRLSQLKMGRVFRDKEGVNLYLRLGTVVFGFGVMIYDGFSVSDHIGGTSSHCRSIGWLTKTLLHFIFVFIQTFYLFKNHRIVYNWRNNVVKCILIHLATSNLLQWLKTVVFAVGDELVFEAKIQNFTGQANVSIFSSRELVYRKQRTVLNEVETLHGLTGSVHTDNETSCAGLSEHLKPFLFPCSVEYSLITMAICYKLYQKEGGAYHQYLTTRQGLSRTASSSCLSVTGPMTTQVSPLELLETNSSKYISPEVLHDHSRLYSKCHHSNRGLFMGLLVVLMTMVGMGLFFYLQKNDKQKFIAITIYQATEITLQMLSCLACVFGFFKQSSLAVRQLTEGEAFDVNLLLLGFCGMFSYNMFLMLPALLNWKNGSLTEHLYVVKSGMEIIETLLQVFFIMESSQRCAGTIENIREKPGRTWVTFLLVCNLSMWGVNTFEVKVVDQHHHLHRSFYSDLSWNIVTFISIPMIIFYRFHSTVCLSDIWVKCYKPYYY